MNKYIYFTATDTTRRVMEALGADDNALNITLKQPLPEQLTFASDDIVYIGFPVFGGRVPALVLERLATLSGNGCKAVVVAVYGGRHYDDSIKEMHAFAEQHGCHVVAAIAAVAQHSIAPSIAAGRPDENDIKTLCEIKEEIDSRNLAGVLFAMPQHRQETYKEYRQLPICPETTDDCMACGLCVEQCPVQAITVDTTCVTDSSRCILCMRCVAVCPTHSRQLPADVLQNVTAMLRNKCTTPRETDVFWN